MVKNRFNNHLRSGLLPHNAPSGRGLHAFASAPHQHSVIFAIGQPLPPQQTAAGVPGPSAGGIVDGMMLRGGGDEGWSSLYGHLVLPSLLHGAGNQGIVIGMPIPVPAAPPPPGSSARIIRVHTGAPVAVTAPGTPPNDGASAAYGTPQGTAACTSPQTSPGTPPGGGASTAFATYQGTAAPSLLPSPRDAQPFSNFMAFATPHGTAAPSLLPSPREMQPFSSFMAFATPQGTAAPSLLPSPREAQPFSSFMM
jgi:hypothetical protein